MNTLAERIKHLRKQKKLTQEQLGKRIGTTKSSVSQWESGDTKKMNGENLVLLAEVFNVSAKWLSTGEGAMAIANNDLQPLESNAVMLPGFDLWDSETPLRDDEVALPFFREVQLAAGAGISEIVENHGCKLRFSKSTLRKHGVDEHNAACVMVAGNSMEPVLPDGTTVGIDKSRTSVVNGEMYAIDHLGHLRIKLLYQMPGGQIRIRSYNLDEWPDELVEPDKIVVIGWVFWYSVLRYWKK